MRDGCHAYVSGHIKDIFFFFADEHECAMAATYIHTCMHTYIHTYIHTHTYIHACIHTYTHTYTHTHIHIYEHDCAMAAILGTH